jgi:uncharacterized protein
MVIRHSQSLDEADYHFIYETLSSFYHRGAMNSEVLHGFFPALNCSPESVMPSQCLPEIWGGDQINEGDFPRI